MEDWNANQLVPMREAIYRQLRAMILEGRFAAGKRLVERDIAAQLNVSRTPIREALFRLESQGLVRTVPRKGVVVETVSASRLLDIFDILSALEALSAELSARRIDGEKAQLCETWIGRIDTFLSGTREEAAAFHLAVCHCQYSLSGNTRLQSMLADLNDYVQAFATAGYRRPGRLELAMTEHRATLAAIRDGKADAAKQAAAEHIERARAAYLEAAMTR
ncbi:MAG: GntR family transcriptional regulator [Sporolactobacillus sp.]